jgi:hypothetical protein
MEEQCYKRNLHPTYDRELQRQRCKKLQHQESLVRFENTFFLP